MILQVISCDAKVIGSLDISGSPWIILNNGNIENAVDLFVPIDTNGVAVRLLYRTVEDGSVLVQQWIGTPIPLQAGQMLAVCAYEAKIALTKLYIDCPLPPVPKQTWCVADTADSKRVKCSWSTFGWLG